MKKKSRSFLFCLLVLFAVFCRPADAAPVVLHLKIAFNQNLPPYQMLADGKMPAGMHVDLLSAVARDEDIVLEYLPFDTTEECLQALQMGDADLILGIAEERAAQTGLRSTNVLSASTLCMLAPKDIAEKMRTEPGLHSYRAVFEYGTANYSVMSKLGVFSFLAVGNQKRVFDSQVERKADLSVGVKDSLLYQLYEQKLEDRYIVVHNYVGTIQYVMAVRPGDSELLYRLNDGLAALRTSGEYERIHTRWVISEHEHDYRRTFRRIAFAAVVFGMIALCYVAFTSHIRTLLKKRVAEKTAALQIANDDLSRRIDQLRHESELRNRIIQHAHNGMVLFDRTFRVTLANSSACHLTGEKSPLIGRDVRELPIFGELLKTNEKTVFAADSSISGRECTLSHDGTLRTFRYSIDRMVEYGEMMGAVLTVDDITAKEAEKHAFFEQEKNKTLNRMIAAIAHDIRNPLMSIRTFATLIKTKRDSQKFMDSFAAFVPDEVDRISRLIEALIHYARPATGTIESVDLKTLVSECMYLADTAAGNGHISVDAAIPEGLFMQTNRDRLKQLLLNLMMNAIDSMEKKLQDGYCGPLPLHLTVTAEQTEGQLSLTVRDEGAGMSEQELLQCTDPFFTTKETGTGLGLAICKQFVQEQGGELKVMSQKGAYAQITAIFREEPQ